jgi:hypothetical protein
VDAVVCAYVALFAARRPEATTTYGDPGTGCIVTPTLPDGHRPEPRAGRTAPPAPTDPVERPDTPEPDDPVRRAVQAYAARQPEVRAATERYVALVTTLLDDAGINYLSVTGRAKSVASFAAKADRQEDGARVFPDPLEQSPTRSASGWSPTCAAT